MRKIREILRLRWEQKRSVRESARSVGASVGVVSETTQRAEAAGLEWEGVEGLSDTELEHRLYPARTTSAVERPRPDPVQIHLELKRPGVTLELLHLEYLQQHPDGYRYTSFCDVYRKWRARRRVWMRQTHKGGEKTFVDFSGRKPGYVDPTTGEYIEMELFVAALGASHLIYAQAVATQQVEDWIEAHNGMVSYFGGVTEVYVPDRVEAKDWLD